MSRKIMRREFLKLSSVAVVGAVAAACSPQVQTPGPTQPPVATQTPVVIKETAVVQQTVEVQKVVTVIAPKTQAEPPMLADLVKAGTLPPVDQRLPVAPLVIGGRDEMGVYGDEVRMTHFDPVWMVSNYDWNAERMLYYSDIDLRTIVPNVLEGWEASPDGTVYTLKLRKGMKYSDGQPVTTEDIRFYFEDIWFNKELSAGGPPWQFRFDGGANVTNVKVEIVDDFTAKFTFAAPFGNFPAHLTRFEPGNNPGIMGPSHYYKQFHTKYADATKLAAAVAAAKLTTWVQLFNQHWQWGLGVWVTTDWIKDYPVLSPWHITNTTSDGLVQMERNPYYWKVDLQGNQLPYIDKLRMDYASTTDAIKLKLAQSELDSLGQHDITMADYPFYKQNEPKANFVVGDYISCMSDRDVFFPQHVVFLEDGKTRDTVLEDIVNHPNFVKALSMAIDRDEINQSLFYGTARMGQLSPMPSSKYYKEKYGSAWAQFDKAAANKLLDDMGLTTKNAQGIRMRKDGKPLTYVIEQGGLRVGPLTPKVSELVATAWRDIGIDASSKEVDSNLLGTRVSNGQVHCTVWHADRGTDLLLPIEMIWYIPTSSGQGGASSKWGQYYLAADKSAPGLIKPPDQILKYYDLFAQMTSTTDENARVGFGQQIFDSLADTPLSIGLLLQCPAPIIFNKNLRNLPRPKATFGWDTYGNSIYHPEAYFYVGGKRA